MTTDLDDLLRATFDGRAASVSSGPDWAGAPARRPRTPWIAAAAAAVTVLGLAGGVAYVRGSDGHATQSGGNPPVACRTALPASWTSALAARPVTIAGRPAYAQAVTPNGRVIAQWIGADHIDHVALVSASGRVTELAAEPGTRLYDSYDADNSHVVLTSSRNYPVGNPDSPVDDVEIIDLGTLKTTHIFGSAPIPAGWTITTGAVIQAEQVYLTVAPNTHNPTVGEVLRYDISTRTFARIARISGAYPEIVRDVRGVGWPGGSVPDHSAPAGLPGFFVSEHGASVFQQVLSDGHAAAWTLRSDPFVVHWTDGAGLFSTFTVRTKASHDPEFTPSVDAVSGRFIVLNTNDTGDPNLVLDARTRAFAATKNTAEQVFGAAGRLAFGSSGHGTTMVPTGSLPDLSC